MLDKLSVQMADLSRLSLDPEVTTHHLTDLFIKTFPELAEEVSDIAGRGAPYIDTGLQEAGEDVLINADVMLAKRDLDRVPAQLQALFDATSESGTASAGLKQAFQSRQTALPATTEFLERAKNEVLNALNQSSGTEFLAAGNKDMDALYAYETTVADQLESALNDRIAGDVLRRNLMLAASLAGSAVAAYLLAGFYLSFSRQVKDLSDSVSGIASGDLSSSIDVRGSDELAQLLRAFDAMRLDLAHLVADIRRGTEAIAHASSEIAQGNADLSARTERQACSLEETAASMEELTGAVNQNASSAADANHNADAASRVARDGSVAVAQVIETMGSIQQSSKRINEITGVIDGIAFQTNILALNAAVEAARAGEQGRGFAVVATEVRNLAQRSASAAKEIKTLIAASTEQIEAGSRQVQNAGQTMEQIAASINAVTETMQGITSASAEQGRGIEQVNMALEQMDEVTQQNAALVEEAAAAAQSMHDQALMLAEAAAVFKVSEQALLSNRVERDPAAPGASSVRRATPVQGRAVAAANDAANGRPKRIS
jgi:methyl-accepting chemotaxis protein